MPKVRILQLMAGPHGVFPAGSIHEFDQRHAELLVQSGQGAWAEPPAAPDETAEQKEEKAKAAKAASKKEIAVKG